MAHSGRAGRPLRCPLSGVKRTCHLGQGMSASEPKADMTLRRLSGVKRKCAKGCGNVAF